ncbi:C-type lectin domain-containing protein [Caenorhabditis elegans]|uniref:C-type lectin domain-containing protein n=1 Tax=Caenorhabditis elegans TaxID=6239 RepID=Q9XVE1_CAEEL|nr:C-type lectin domain-containing protein [Caenorhabditis elegans]CAB03881.1 C-type lectin domain-containing protein [Caenorhabditis elegans]|eukprot:NP_507547.1 C-type LECtin [Caenorhabditis elegans]
MIRLTLLLFGLLGAATAQNCNTGGIYNSQFNRCYQYFTAPAQFSFAEQQCNLLGGHLASVQNGQENALLQSNAANSFKKSNYSDYWIGANDLETSGTWKWTDPSVTFDYSNWQLGEPQSGSDCAIQDKGDGTWSAIGCTSYRPYLCVTPVIMTATCPPITTPIPTTCPTPAPCPIKQCVPSCDQGWTYFSPTDFCYRVYHGEKFNDAEASCVLLGGHLASIHSLAENTFVNNIASCGIKEGKYEHLAWIGMHKVGQDWVWTDGTPSDYFNWAPKQPDNPKKEFCVQTAPDLSHDKWYENWNNLECNEVMRAYICKKASIHN